MEFLTTQEIADRFGVKAQSVRRAVCTRGEFMKMKPRKLPNNRLAWARADVDALCQSYGMTEYGIAKFSRRTTAIDNSPEVQPCPS